MKKLLLSLALLMLGVLITSQGAFATCDSNTDRWSVNGWCVDTYGQLTPKSITTSSQQIGSQGGYHVPVLNYTSANTPVSLSSQQSGVVINDTGGTTDDTLTGYGSKWTLPSADGTGLKYTLTVGSKSFVTLDTLLTFDRIDNSISGTGFTGGTSILSTGQAGDTITVVSTSSGHWTIVAERGSWTNNSTN